MLTAACYSVTRIFAGKIESYGTREVVENLAVPRVSDHPSTLLTYESIHLLDMRPSSAYTVYA